ncbi:hypothetical protein [Plantibacter sp. 2H11-2]|uniref:hypothetical protein n=1 Tax=Plantibacter sp. 2H11-2 TaxID=3414431 RepID=UPI003CECBDD6
MAQNETEVVQDGSTEWDPDLEFYATGQAFTRAMDALREVHSGLSDGAGLMDAPEQAMASPKVLRTLDQDSSNRLRVVLKSIFATGDVTRDGFLHRLYEAIEDEPWGSRVFLGFSEMVTRHKRSPIFHAAMLTSTVSRFEAHLAMLASDFFHTAPASLNQVSREEAKEFSLADLQNLGSVDAAIQAAIESRINKLQFGSISDWKGFFKDKLKVDLSLLCDWDEVREIYERRNCVVHHNGVASQRYVAAVSNGITVGDILEVDAAYTSRAVVVLEALGTLLLAAVWRKLGADADGPNMFLNRVAYDAMLAERWQYSQVLNENILANARDESEKHVAQVNVWLTLKNIHGLEYIRADVEGWDLSASNDRYLLAQAALLNELDACFRYIDALLEREDLTAEDLATWPLLKDVRSDARSEKYGDLIRRYIEEDVLDDPSLTTQSDSKSEVAPTDSSHPSEGPEEVLKTSDDIVGDSSPQISGDVETKDKK